MCLLIDALGLYALAKIVENEKILVLDGSWLIGEISSDFNIIITLVIFIC